MRSDKGTVSNVKIKQLAPTRATAYFDQVYSSDTCHDTRKKTIQLIKRYRGWKSKREIWIPTGRGQTR
jgi:hypothetical protein